MREDQRRLGALFKRLTDDEVLEGSILTRVSNRADRGIDGLKLILGAAVVENRSRGARRRRRRYRRTGATWAWLVAAMAGVGGQRASSPRQGPALAFSVLGHRAWSVDG